VHKIYTVSLVVFSRNEASMPRFAGSCVQTSGLVYYVLLCERGERGCTSVATILVQETLPKPLRKKRLPVCPALPRELHILLLPIAIPSEHIQTLPPHSMADRTPPTPLAMLIGTAIIAGLSGYMIGIASSLGFLPVPFATKTPPVRGISNYDDEEESEEEDVEESILDHAPNWANGLEADKRDGLRAPAPTAAQKQEASWEDSAEEYKLVLVVRMDLGMTKGKSSCLSVLRLNQLTIF
jgi:hypothetical protein